MKNDLTKFEKDLLKSINSKNNTQFDYRHLMEWSNDKKAVEKNLQDGEKIYEAGMFFVAIKS